MKDKQQQRPRSDLQRYIEATALAAALQSAVTRAQAENAQLRARLPVTAFEFCEVLG